MLNKEDIFLHQACLYPLESIEKLNEFLGQIKNLFTWARVGFLTDEGYKNQVFLLLSDEQNASFRLNLPESDMRLAIEQFLVKEKIIYRHLQGAEVTHEDLSSMDTLSKVWLQCKGQSAEISLEEFEQLLSMILNEHLEKQKGRNGSFTTKTLTQVMQDSHGHCMFEGCGERLDIDWLTGRNGNFAYNAHNVGSSVNGPRGIILISEKQSDEPENILLLCDKHHRLIDRVAIADYNAARLTKMREDFVVVAKRLLEGLSYEPIPVFSVLWPVGSYSSSSPELREIAESLSLLKARIQNDRMDIGQNDRILMKRPERLIQDIDEIVKDAAEEILSLSRQNNYKAALFAFGPMPALVGLGALLGNKNEITPMLRYRDGNCWMWPQSTPVDKPYNILLDDEMPKSREVTLSVSLTAQPESMKNKAAELGLPHIKIEAEVMGNGAIPHPENGNRLKADVQRLLQLLRDKYDVKRVHLLICASNAASVFLGQAYDSHQPDILVYDFVDGDMQPRIEISARGGRVSLTRPQP